MGKRKGEHDDYADDDGRKKHKKHKKKHKHRRAEGEEEHVLSQLTSPKTSFKLKLKIGSETLGTKNVTAIEATSRSSFDDGQDDSIINVTDDASCDDNSSGAITPQAGKAAESKLKDDSSDEEERWLNALEAGTLDDAGDFPKNRDPSLLTARQRAMLHGHQFELQQLPSGYKTVELTEEQKQRRQLRAKKRRQQAQEKRENDKKQTLERLLQKQATKSKGPKARGSKWSNVPRLRYINSGDGISISLPPGFPFPLQLQTALAPRPAVTCAVEGCTNAKKYSCSKTLLPLCSKECYLKISHSLSSSLQDNNSSQI